MTSVLAITKTFKKHRQKKAKLDKRDCNTVKSFCQQRKPLTEGKVFPTLLHSLVFGLFFFLSTHVFCLLN